MARPTEQTVIDPNEVAASTTAREEAGDLNSPVAACNSDGQQPGRGRVREDGG